MATVTVRRLKPSDIETFRALRLEALRAEALRAEPDAYASTAADWEALSAAEWAERLEHPVLAIFRDGAAVGLMGLVRQASSRMAHRATLVMAYVRAGERGSGVAATLLDGVIAEAQALGVSQLELAVSADNLAAIRFYRRAGFVEVGRIPGGFRHPDGDVDEVLMALRLEGAESPAPVAGAGR